MTEKGEPSTARASPKPLNGNYQIRIDHTLKGKADSVSTVTADAKFSYQGLGAAATVDGNSIPSTMVFLGN